jgi:hypothetical protein
MIPKYERRVILPLSYLGDRFGERELVTVSALAPLAYVLQPAELYGPF